MDMAETVAVYPLAELPGMPIRKLVYCPQCGVTATALELPRPEGVNPWEGSPTAVTWCEAGHVMVLSAGSIPGSVSQRLIYEF